MLFDSFAEIGIHEELKLYVQIDLKRGSNIQPLFALVDTGATSTLVPKFIADELGIDYISGKARSVNGISGSLEGRVHKVETALISDEGIEIGSHPIEITFVENSDLVLAGMNFLTKFDWKLIFSKKKLEVYQP